MSDLQARIITNLLDQVETLKLAAAPQPTHSGDTTADAALRPVLQGPLNSSTVGSAVVEAHDTFIFDMDGVLFVGANRIARSHQCFAKLLSLNKRVFFITNNSTKSRDAYVKKLSGMGFDGIEKDMILTSGYATALYLQSIGFKRKVYSVAGDGLSEELSLLGIEHEGNFAHAKAHLDRLEVDDATRITVDPSVGAVVTGFNSFANYHTLSYAQLALQDPDVLFLATNDDRLTPQGKQKVLLPGGGMWMAALDYVTGRKATVVGKPTVFMLDVLFKAHPELSRERAIMIGDRLDTDILFGKDGGLKTLLVLSGVTPEKTLLSDENTIHPDMYTSKLPDICEAVKAKTL